MKQYSIIKSIWLITVVVFMFIAGSLPSMLVLTLSVVLLFLPLVGERLPGFAPDERQRYISFLASHIGFYVFVILVVLVITGEFIRNGCEVPVQWAMILIVPLVVKLLFSLVQSFEYIVGGRVITWFFGGAMLLFALFSHGFTLEGMIESAPGVVVIVSGLVARRFRVVSSFVLILVAGIVSFMIINRGTNIYIVILMLSVLSLPLFVAAYLFYFFPVARMDD